MQKDMFIMAGSQFWSKSVLHAHFSWALEATTVNSVLATCVSRGGVWPQPIPYLPQEKKEARTESLSQGPNPKNKLPVEMQWSRKPQVGKIRHLIQQLLAKSFGHHVSCFIEKLEYNSKGVKYWMENVIEINSDFKMPPLPLLVLDGVFEQPTDFYWTWSLISTTCKWYIFS